jgi:hypothetical protein
MASTPRATARPSVTGCGQAHQLAQRRRREYSTRRPQKNVAASKRTSATWAPPDGRAGRRPAHTTGDARSVTQTRRPVTTGGVGGGGRGHRWRSPRHRSRSAARRRLPQRATLAQRGRRSTTRRHWSRGETAGRTDVTAGGVSGNGGIPYRATTPIQQAFPQRWANGFESKAVGLPSAS